MLKFDYIDYEKDCKDLWESFVPKKVLWDLWEIRYFFISKDSEIHFIVGYDDINEVIGFIPLIYDYEYGRYYYFGDNFPEQNRFYIKDKTLLPKFLEACPKDTHIYYIDSSEKKYYDFKEGDKRYFLDLKGFEGNIENYLKTFNKKHRKNLRYDLKKLKEKNFEIIKNKKKHFSNLVKLNKECFGNDSDYNDKDFLESIKKIINFAEEKNMLDIISICFEGRIKAVGIGIIYNNIYYVISSGRDIKIKNLGKVLIYEQISSALKKDCDTIDFLSTESGWKDLWNLDSEQLYEFEK